MITTRRSQERGHANHGWLDTYHSFSFAGYYDPSHMGFRDLRVINEDKVAPARGFGMHPHDNMEILTYLVDGKLTHRDTAGHEATIGRGSVQFMSAGSGLMHSESNGSKTDPVHLLQIWILPAEQDTEPRYADREFEAELDKGGLVLLASPDGRDDSIRIGQDVRLYGARPKAGTTLEHALAPERAAWVQLIRGAVTVNGQQLVAGDAAALEQEAKVTLEVTEEAELLLFDLA